MKIDKMKKYCCFRGLCLILLNLGIEKYGVCTQKILSSR